MKRKIIIVDIYRNQLERVWEELQKQASIGKQEESFVSSG